MNRLCLAVLANRAGVLLVLSGILPGALGAQVDSTGSSNAEPSRRQDAWVSAGIGVGLHGVAAMGSGWYSNNNFVVGAHAADVTQLWGPDVHDAALMIGVRNLSPHSLIMIAAGPAVLGGQLYVGDPYTPPNGVKSNEIGMAVSAEAIINLSQVGIGFDAFVARSENRLVEGVILSLQVGWLGN